VVNPSCPLVQMFVTCHVRAVEGDRYGEWE
jgi:hypothetical protein